MHLTFNQNDALSQNIIRVYTGLNVAVHQVLIRSINWGEQDIADEGRRGLLDGGRVVCSTGWASNRVLCKDNV